MCFVGGIGGVQTIACGSNWSCVKQTLDNRVFRRPSGMWKFQHVLHKFTSSYILSFQRSSHPRDRLRLINGRRACVRWRHPDRAVTWSWRHEQIVGTDIESGPGWCTVESHLQRPGRQCPPRGKLTSSTVIMKQGFFWKKNLVITAEDFFGKMIWALEQML